MNGRDMKTPDHPTEELLEHYEQAMNALEVLKERIKEIHPLPEDYDDREDFRKGMMAHREWLDTCQKFHYDFLAVLGVIQDMKMRGQMRQAHTGMQKCGGPEEGIVEC